MKLSFAGLLSLLVVSTSSLQAQTTELPSLDFSGSVGMHMSRITEDAFENAFSYNLGAMTRYYFIPMIGVGTGLEFEARKLGVKSEIINLKDATANYLDIPLLVSARFGSFTHRANFDIGGIYAIALSDSLGKVDGYDTTIEPQSKIGLAVRGGYSYNMPNNLGFGVEASLKYLPAGAFPLKVGTVQDDNDQHYISTGLNLKLHYGMFL